MDAVAYDGIIYCWAPSNRVVSIRIVESDDGTLAKLVAEVEEYRKASGDARREGKSQY